MNQKGDLAVYFAEILTKQDATTLYVMEQHGNSNNFTH